MSNDSTLLNVVGLQWCSCEISSGHTLMASVVARAYMGVWGQSPQRGAGAEPWWGFKPPEAKAVFV